LAPAKKIVYFRYMKPIAFNLQYILSVCLTLCIIFSSCVKEEAQPDTNKTILSIAFKNADSTAIKPENVSVKIETDTIKIKLPAGTNLKHLIPAIAIKGKTIEPASGVPQDFSFPVNYTVTAADGTIKHFVVCATVNKTLYIGGTSNFYALDAVTGALIWQHSGGNFAYSDPLLHDGVVYAGSASLYGELYAFDALTGAVIWQHYLGTDGIECGAAISANTLYIGSNDDHFYALDAATGNERWNFTTGSNISSTPVLTGNKVIFGSSDANLYALDTASGNLIWVNYGAAMVNQSGAALSNGVVFVGNRDANLKAVDVNTGLLKWSYYTGVSLEMSSPAVAGGTVYVTGWYNVPAFNVGGSLYAVDESTGTLVWQSLDSLGFSSSPVVAGGIVYAAADNGNFYAVNAATGSILWQHQIYANASGSGAAVLDDLVYVGGAGTGYIYAFDRTSGTIQWQYHIDDYMTSTPATGRKKKSRFASMAL
jgi:outer membrane protein assembly factor BamB